MVFLDRLSHYVNLFLMVIAGVFLVAMIALTCTNVFLRAAWIPVAGTFELMGYFGAAITAFAMGYTQTKKGAFRGGYFVYKFPEKDTEHSECGKFPHLHDFFCIGDLEDFKVCVKSEKQRGSNGNSPDYLLSLHLCGSRRLWRIGAGVLH